MISLPNTVMRQCRECDLNLRGSSCLSTSPAHDSVTLFSVCVCVCVCVCESVIVSTFTGHLSLAWLISPSVTSVHVAST